MSTIHKDGWTYNENWNYVAFLMRETKENDLKDVDNLKKALGRIQTSMGTRFGRRFSFHSIKTKLEQMRIRHRLWKKFLNTPGVTYDIENCESTVTDAYWQAVDREECYVDLDTFLDADKNQLAVVPYDENKELQGRRLFDDEAVDGGTKGEASGEKMD
ncbi:hypothetical protein ACJIZ3_013918 [Penstemon smallii]|uniref:Myb/SANT-like domain-containing protein n=1 Tax=Penstemon smallii TaxID=265156 RepID=A0ABD3RI97_9LAMI